MWVLTGDKEETAVNISYSTGHFQHDMTPLSLTKQSSSDECRMTLENFNKLLVCFFKCNTYEQHIYFCIHCHLLLTDDILNYYCFSEAYKILKRKRLLTKDEQFLMQGTQNGLDPYDFLALNRLKLSGTWHKKCLNLLLLL